MGFQAKQKMLTVGILSIPRWSRRQVAMTIYLVARYDTPWSRLFSQAIPVRLGEVSYSIYLLHEIIPSALSGSVS
jgi:hypothetical protein